MVAATMGGEPVQILRVKDGRNVEFNEAELKRILLADHVKDRPVVVISIAGEYRQGKSFLLNFFLRYLKNNGRSDWMEDAETPLHGFQWRAGSTRETTGILLWNEVFLMKNSKGEEVAVLLMDTQGTFDCESTMKESTTIFALSMMTSSQHIYNVMNNIKEDDLQHLQFFAEYGKLVQKEYTTRPFQKLLFVVRDWNWPQNFEFGSRGGRSLIASCLEIKEGQATELKTLRQSILSSFCGIDGFLLPHPGKKVVRETSFDGRLGDIEEEFRENLQELVASVLAPENLLVKQVNGQTLTCEHLFTFFKTYVEVFKGSDLPEPATMLLATANATHVAAMDKARRHYMSAMINQRPRRCLVKLHEFHRGKLTEAKKVFYDFPKMGGDEMSCRFVEALTKDLEELFQHFFKEEEDIIRKEQEEQAKRQRERLEHQKREQQRERERTAEREKWEAREAEMERERERMEEKLRKGEEEQARERERTAKAESEREELKKKIVDMEGDVEWRKVVQTAELIMNTVSRICDVTKSVVELQRNSARE